MYTLKNGVLKIDDGVTEILKKDFSDCTFEKEDIKSVIIPESVKKIGDRAFYCCENLTEIKFHKGIKQIGDSAFAGCKNLVTVTIPESVREIGKQAFLHCENLTTVTIPESVNKIGYEAFRNCSINNLDSKVLKIKNGCALVEDGLILLYSANIHLNEITIPEGVFLILDDAFLCCEKLTTVTIPESVKEIGKKAFVGCENLVTVTIPESVKKIGKEAFRDCAINNLDSKILKIKNGCALSEDGHTVLYGTNVHLTEIIIPEGVKSTESYAFYEYKNLVTITIPESVKKIGEYAFSDCDNLHKIIYHGTKEEWDNIQGDFKKDLKGVEIIFEK